MVAGSHLHPFQDLHQVTIAQDSSAANAEGEDQLFDSSWFPRTFGHYTDPDLIIEEMEEAGYELEQDLGFIDRQSFLIFRRLTDEASPG